MESWKAYLFTQDEFQKFLIVFSNHNGFFLGILTFAPPPPPQRKISLGFRIGKWVKVRVSFRVGGQPDNCPRGK